MSTAGRPTFDTARGGQNRGDLSAMSKQYSSRDLPSHKTLKYRQTGQGTIEETRTRDFRKELEERDRGTKRTQITKNYDDPKRKKLELQPARTLDADDPQEESDSSDDDEENEEALLAELAKIKREREIEKAKQEMEKRREEEQIRIQLILNGNPLVTRHLSGTEKNDFTVKRRWNDDVVFKNCARSEPEKTKEFINDSLRSEFHKKFMEKYIQ